jgi:hypothetical protein
VDERGALTIGSAFIEVGTTFLPNEPNGMSSPFFCDDPTRAFPKTKNPSTVFSGDRFEKPLS